MFDGLWAGGDALTQDFGLNLYRIQVNDSACTAMRQCLQGVQSPKQHCTISNAWESLEDPTG